MANVKTYREIENEMTIEEIKQAFNYWSGMKDGARAMYDKARHAFGLENEMVQMLWNEYLNVHAQWHEFSIINGQISMREQMDNMDETDREIFHQLNA